MQVPSQSQRSGSRDAILSRIRRSELTRREFIARTGGLGAALLLGPTLLAACQAMEDEVINFANWPFYIDLASSDPEAPGYFDTTTLEDFEAETGIHVNYIEEINDNNEWFATVEGSLRAGQSIQRDIAVLTDWMAARFIREGWTEQLDKSRIPNAANLVEALRSPSFDPNRDFTLPWQSGMTAIGYDPNLTGRELTSINDIFDPAFAGRVTMLTEMRDTIGLVMLGMGLDPSQATLDDARAANDKIRQAVADGQIRAFTGNEYTEDLANGNSVAAFAWSGDVIQLQAENPDVRFLVPEEGLMLWSDNMLIPLGAENKANAETYMNYVYDPRVAAKIESWVNFICPVEGAQEALRELGNEIGDDELAALADDPLIFPTADDLSKTSIFRALDAEEEKEFDALFAETIGA